MKISKKQQQIILIRFLEDYHSNLMNKDFKKNSYFAFPRYSYTGQTHIQKLWEEIENLFNDNIIKLV
jgi:hypothetical protein